MKCRRRVDKTDEGLDGGEAVGRVDKTGLMARGWVATPFATLGRVVGWGIRNPNPAEVISSLTIGDPGRRE